jgi:hypothetical protein
MYNVQTKMIRTLSEQHWDRAMECMIAENSREYIAGSQGDWLFKVRKVADEIERVTYLKGEIAVVVKVPCLRN